MALRGYEVARQPEKGSQGRLGFPRPRLVDCIATQPTLERSYNSSEEPQLSAVRKGSTIAYYELGGLSGNEQRLPVRRVVCATADECVPLCSSSSEYACAL